MLRFMRNQKFIKVLMWIVIISFVGWLGFELGYGGKRRAGANPEVGEIAGAPIYWAEYRHQIANLREYQRRQSNAPVDDFDLDEQIWQQNVRSILTRQAIERMHIVVTADEIAQEEVDNPPRGFERIPDFQRQDGSFDRDKYRQFLSTMTQERWFQITGMTLSDYESQVRLELQVQKLQKFIENGGWITEAALRQAYTDQNEKLTLRVVAAPVSLVPDTSVGEEEIRREYQANLSSFKEPARAKLNYALIPRKATRLDSLRAWEEISDIHRRLTEGADFAELAHSYSEDDVTAREGGNLGTFARGHMVPEFDSTAFALKAGQISNPIHTRFGWHIVKVERRVTGGQADSVEARHILIKDTEPGIETVESLQAVAESLTSAGPNFQRRAEEHGLTTGTTDWFVQDVLFPIPAVRDPLRRLVRWAFIAEVGAVANVATTNDFLVVVQLADRQKAGPKPLEEVRGQLETKLRMSKRVDRAAEMLEPIAAKLKRGQTMDQAVLGTDFEVLNVGPFKRADYLPEVRAGAMDGFTGAAFALTRPGQMTGAVKIENRGAYILDLVERSLDWSKYNQEKDRIRTQLIRQQRQSLFADWELYTRKTADIKDHRDRFYTYN